MNVIQCLQIKVQVMFSGNNGQKSRNKQQQKSSHNTQQGLTTREIQERVKKVSARLSRENICKQHKLISNMNLKLQATLKEFIKFQELQNIPLQDVMKILQRVSYLQAVQALTTSTETSTTTINHPQSTTSSLNNNNNKSSKHLSSQKQHYHAKYEHKISSNANPYNLLYKLKYHHSQRIIILAGINRLWTESAIREFNATSLETVNQRCSSYKKHPVNNYQHPICQISGVNQFWIAVEADTAQNAQFFKKFIRLRKKSYQAKKDFSFKQDKRRVRIVMQNQDFYTLLVDAMTQKKYLSHQKNRNSQFIKRLVNPNSGMFPTMCLRDTRRMSVFDNQEYQLSLKKSNKILYFPIIMHRPQFKEGDDHFTLDEVYSEDRSRVSQFFESSNMDDLVQKADQATQAQSLGVGTQDDSVETQELELNKLGSNDDEITSQMVSMNNRNRVHEEKSWQSLDGFEGDIQDKIIDDKSDKVEQIKKGQNEDLLKKREKIEESQPESDRDAIVVEINKSPDTSQQKTSPDLTIPLTLHDLKQPQIPSKYLAFYFSTHTQTQRVSLDYTKMKRLEQQYIKKSASRIKLTPGIPQDFRQVSQQERNRDLFFFNIFKSMEKRSQKKEWISEFF